MFLSRLLSGSVFASILLFSLSSPASGSLAIAEAAAAKKGHHLGELEKAAHELKHAHSEVTGKNVGKASEHVTAAIGHIEKAIELHKHHLNQTRTGVTGTITSAAHHHHHHHLHEALHAAKEAEKHIASGKTAEAAKELSKAHEHVELAMHSHKALIGK
jgi:hypothetical protein